MVRSDRWDRWAPTYDRGLAARLFFRPLYARLVEAFDPRAGERVLDVGAGTGSLAAAMAGRGARVVAVDPSAGMARQAQAKIPGRVAAAAAESLPFPDGSFDAVVTSMSLHHWHEAARGVAEIARVLAPGGRALLADIERRGLIRRIALRVAHRGAHDTHVLRGEEVSARLRQAGLEQVRQRRQRGGVMVTLAERPR